MDSFIKCPFCCGGEAVGAVATSMIREAIALYLRRWRQTLPDPVVCELENICNVIANTEERTQPQELPPICPTPDKAKYGDAKHAAPNAAKYKQHPYQCACGYWHLSKQSGAEHGAKINSPPATVDEFDAIDPLML